MVLKAFDWRKFYENNPSWSCCSGIHSTAQPMKWKVCGMRDPENIAALLALQPDYLGFIFGNTRAICHRTIAPYS